MAEQKLEIVIGGNTVDARKSIKQLEDQLKRFQDGLKNATGQSIVRYNNAIEATSKRIKALSGNLVTANKSFGSAQYALTNLSRVASDAPFGFIAIQNNIDPLIQSFQQLSAQSGGAKNAFKALFASLAGPAGVVLGISVVSSAITGLIQKYGSLSNALDALMQKNDAFSKTQREIASIRKSANEEAGQEIARLDLLRSVATDYTNSLENRKEAASQLLKVYKEYLPNLTQEQILNDKAADAINRAKDAILAKALATAAEKKLAEIGAKILDNELEKIDAATRYGRALDINRKANEESIRQGVKGVAAVNTATVAANTELEKTRDRLTELGQAGLELQRIYDTVLKLGTSFAKKAGDAFIPDPKGGEAKKQIADFSKFLARDFVTELDLSVDEEFRKNNPFTPPKQFGPFNPIDLIIADINVREANERAKRIAAFQEQQRISLLARNKATFEALKAQQQEFQNTLTIGLAQPLGDLIFNFLDKGKFAFKDFADAAITAIKRIVAQLVATKIIQLLASLTPFGQGLKAAKGIGAFLQGGFSFVTRGASAPNFGGIQGGLSGEVVFVQRGADLVGVLNRTNNRIGRVG